MLEAIDAEENPQSSKKIKHSKIRSLMARPDGQAETKRLEPFNPEIQSCLESIHSLRELRDMELSTQIDVRCHPRVWKNQRNSSRPIKDHRSAIENGNITKDSYKLKNHYGKQR